MKPLLNVSHLIAEFFNSGGKQWGLNPFAEILFLENGDVLFNELNGNRTRLRQLSPRQISFIKGIEESSKYSICNDSILSDSSNTEPDVVDLAYVLIKEGLLIPSGSDCPSYTIDVKEFLRFGSFIAWLGQFSGERYGTSAFKRIRDAKIAIVGTGGSGSLCAVLLAACGIGALVLVDGDVVGESNLVRQVFFSEADVRDFVPKVTSLKRHINALSSFTDVNAIPIFVSNPDELRPLIRDCQLVILTADQPRILVDRIVNNACAQESVPLIYAFVDRIGPMFIPGKSACFECLEAVWRAEAGDEHDEIVLAFQNRPMVEYPSMVSGPVQIAEALFREAIGLVSGAYEPESVNHMVRFSHCGSERIHVPLLPDCPVCSRRKLRRRP